jgi:hypothetical protein
MLIEAGRCYNQQATAGRPTTLGHLTIGWCAITRSTIGDHECSQTHLSIESADSHMSRCCSQDRNSANSMPDGVISPKASDSASAGMADFCTGFRDLATLVVLWYQHRHNLFDTGLKLS